MYSFPNFEPVCCSMSSSNCCFLTCIQVFQEAGKEGRNVAQSCPTLCDPVDCSLPGSSVHGIFQAIVLEWIAISFSSDLPDPGIKPRSPAL